MESALDIYQIITTMELIFLTYHAYYCSKTFLNLIKAIIIDEFIEVLRLENRLKSWIKKNPRKDSVFYYLIPKVLLG